MSSVGFLGDYEHTIDDKGRVFVPKKYLAAMPQDEPRFAVYDLEFKKNGIDQSKLCFVMFIPDDCKAGVNKVAYAQAKDACKSKVQPTHKEFQINHPADLNEAEWIEDLS